MVLEKMLARDLMIIHSQDSLSFAKFLPKFKEIHL